jgi:hypothetical protein
LFIKSSSDQLSRYKACLGNITIILPQQIHRKETAIRRALHRICGCYQRGPQCRGLSACLAGRLQKSLQYHGSFEEYARTHTHAHIQDSDKGQLHHRKLRRSDCKPCINELMSLLYVENAGRTTFYTVHQMQALSCGLFNYQGRRWRSHRARPHSPGGRARRSGTSRSLLCCDRLALHARMSIEFGSAMDKHKMQIDDDNIRE